MDGRQDRTSDPNFQLMLRLDVALIKTKASLSGEVKRLPVLQLNDERDAKNSSLAELMTDMLHYPPFNNHVFRVQFNGSHYQNSSMEDVAQLMEQSIGQSWWLIVNCPAKSRIVRIQLTALPLLTSQQHRLLVAVPENISLVVDTREVAANIRMDVFCSQRDCVSWINSSVSHMRLLF